MILRKFLSLFRKKEKVRTPDKLDALALMMKHELMYEKFMIDFREKHGIVLTLEQKLQEAKETAAARAESIRIIMESDL